MRGASELAGQKRVSNGANYLATEEHEGEHSASALGVGPDVARDLSLESESCRQA